MGQLSGRVALVTGAASGIGRATAVRFAASGASVALVGTDGPGEQTLESAADLVRATGAEALALRADVRRLGELQRVVADTATAFGRLDAVFANAGVIRLGSVLDVTEDDWDLTYEVNVKGVWNTVRAVTPLMVDGGRGGAITVTGSIGSERPHPGSAAYGSSKWAVAGLVKAAANTLGPHGIRVNLVEPTTVRTPMSLAELRDPGSDIDSPETQAHYRDMHVLPVAMLDPEDVAEAVLWLSSDSARYVTGIQLPVDAGMLTKRG